MALRIRCMPPPCAISQPPLLPLSCTVALFSGCCSYHHVCSESCRGRVPWAYACHNAFSTSTPSTKTLALASWHGCRLPLALWKTMNSSFRRLGASRNIPFFHSTHKLWCVLAAQSSLRFDQPLVPLCAHQGLLPWLTRVTTLRVILCSVLFLALLGPGSCLAYTLTIAFLQLQYPDSLSFPKLMVHSYAGNKG